jgi:hypothetical protein
MTNVRIDLKNRAGTVTKSYIIDGMLNIRDRKSQPTTPVSFPFGSESMTLLNTLMGQKREFSGSFIILQRADDYTNGKGTPVNYSPDEQRTYIQTTLFTRDGFHVLVDEYGNSYTGRITDMEIIRSGDDPVKFDASFAFIMGGTPGA